MRRVIHYYTKYQNKNSLPFQYCLIVSYLYALISIKMLICSMYLVVTIDVFI